MQDFTQDQVAQSLANLGRYRVMRVQTVANQGMPDGISGSTILALGLRETNLKNIEGGVKLVDGRWVKQDEPLKKDVGFVQINRGIHLDDLRLMPGVKSGTWGPVIGNRTAADDGYVMRFEDALRWTIENLHDSIALAEDKFVNDPVRFAIAAHNAGQGGAMRGYKEGDYDKYTTHGDYSAWVLRHRTLINRWLGGHPNWRV